MVIILVVNHVKDSEDVILVSNFLRSAVGMQNIELFSSIASIDLPVTDLPNGMYIIAIKSSSLVTTKQLIISR